MAFLVCIQYFSWKPLDFRNQFPVLCGKEPKVFCICPDLQPVWNHTVTSCCSEFINLNFPNKPLNPKTIWSNSIITYIKWDSENHFQMTFLIRSLLIAVTGTTNSSQITHATLAQHKKSKLNHPTQIVSTSYIQQSETYHSSESLVLLSDCSSLLIRILKLPQLDYTLLLSPSTEPILLSQKFDFNKLGKVIFFKWELDKDAS